MRYEVITPDQMGPEVRARWCALQDGNRALWNPFFSPGWTETVAQARRDIRIVLIEDGGELVGLLPVQKMSPFSAMPVGAPLTDYAGIISAPDRVVSVPDICRALGVDRFDFTHVPGDQGSFASFAHVHDHSWVADISGGSAAYSARRKAGGGGEMLKKIQQRRRKLEREHSGVSVVGFTSSAADYDAMVIWKQRQLAETRQPDLFARPWIAQTIRAAYEADLPDFGGAMFTIRIDDKPIACLLALRSRFSLHAWFTAYDEGYADVSPGNAAFLAAVEIGADAGYDEIDFGPGDYQIKRALATSKRPIVDGFVGGANFASWVRGAAFGVRRVIENNAKGKFAHLPGKAMRRIDYWRGLRSA